ncbi:S8 family serine peptidase [Lysobacter maris]|uniref:S8 family serine peptidase n=1 Tax=Marilutibacter maris TaxID=1605891 RepID=A0A508AB64_9GAMM|nr:S8 family serine peptidase [Lysobacter maris]KAB8170011.1 S8 family serine peptidase [Lysobacter maris]
MQKGFNKNYAMLGLAAACSAVLLWSQRDATSTENIASPPAATFTTPVPVAASAGQPGSAAGVVPPASLSSQYTAPAPDNPAQARLGAGQLLQVLQALPPQLRTAAGTPSAQVARAGRATSVSAQIAALDRAGIPARWRDGEKVKVNVNLALDAAAIQNPERLAQASSRLLQSLRAGGIEATDIPGSPSLEALVPVSQLEWVAGHEGVAQVALMNLAETAAFSDGATASNLDHLRSLGRYIGIPQAQRLDLRGEGLTIAIMDQFGDDEGQIAALQAAGEWPGNTLDTPDKVVLTPPTGTSFGATGERHGNAVTEIVYDIAPQAKFRVYDAGRTADWIRGIQDAANLDAQNRPLGAPRAQVITASQGGLVGAPGDGTPGLGSYKGLYEALEAANRNGVIVVNAAGNYAEAHWDGDSDAGNATNVLQDFDPATAGVQDTNIVSLAPKFGDCYPVGLHDADLAARYQIIAALSWNDWPSATNTANTDYRLELVYWRDEVRTRKFDWSTFRYATTVTPAGWAVVQQSDYAQNGGGGQEPMEIFAYEPPANTASAKCAGVFSTAATSGGGIFALRVVRKTAGAANFLRITTGKLPLQYAQPERSLAHPADSASVVTVAALNAADSVLESYSSRGPVLASGGARPAGQAAGNAKPDMGSFANVDTVSYGDNAFDGTSAAAPHVAALAALGLQHQRQLTDATAPAPLPVGASAQQRADREALLNDRRNLQADATYDALVQVAGTQGNDLGAAGFDSAFGTGRLTFHAQSQACFLSALYATDYRSLLPADGTDYDALGAGHDVSCSANN